MPLFSFCLYTLVILLQLNMPLHQHHRQFLQFLIFDADFSYQMRSCTKNRCRNSVPISGVCVISFSVSSLTCIVPEVRWSKVKVMKLSGVLLACICILIRCDVHSVCWWMILSDDSVSTASWRVWANREFQSPREWTESKESTCDVCRNTTCVHEH